MNFEIFPQKTGVKSIDNNINMIKAHYAQNSKKIDKKKKILFLGSTNPSFFKFYSQMQKSGDFEFIWMRYKKNYTETFTSGYVIKIPGDISRVNYHNLVQEAEITQLEIDKINSNEEYKWAYENITSVYPHNNGDRVRKTILYSELYFLNVYNIIKPAAVILWNPYVSFNRIAKNVAEMLKIPVIYAESGVLPATISFSTWGDLGESRPSVDWRFFMRLPIDDIDRKNAEKVVEYLYKSRINRNVQPSITNQYYLDKSKPTILVAGQNDTECGMQPYTDKSEMYSPIFKSSEDVMEYIAELGKKNDWNVIYKPHPIVERRGLEKKSIPENVIYINQGDINELIDKCDVCVTILSTTSYVALIRKKPVVIFGKIQFHGQGCAYEVFEKQMIEDTIAMAIEQGFSPNQRCGFIEHIARMLKYYLYDSTENRDVLYGKSVEEAVMFINKVVEGEAQF